MKPNDVYRIKKDSDFKYWLKTNRNNNEKLIHLGMNPLVTSIQEVINIIEHELE